MPIVTTTPPLEVRQADGTLRQLTQDDIRGPAGATGETGSTGAAGTPGGPPGPAGPSGPVDVFRVKDAPYNAVGNGTTDDTAAINAALAAAAASSAAKKVVFVPAGRYLCNTGSNASGIAWALFMTGDNVTLMLDPGATLVTDVSSGGVPCSNIFVWGDRSNAPSAWNANRVSSKTVYGMQPVAAGANTITLTTAGDAANFAIGDRVYLRTGQMTSSSSGITPDAEINRVVAKSGALLTLEIPTAKPYVQQYYIGTTGLEGPTTTTSNGNPAPFGISNVEAVISSNLKITGGALENTADAIAVQVYNVDGFKASDVRGTFRSQGWVFQESRRGVFTDLDIRFTGTGTTQAFHWPCGAATGTTDVSFNRIRATAENGLVMYHCHEGVSRARFRDCLAFSRPGLANIGIGAFDIHAYCRDILIDGCHVINGNAGVRVDEICPDGGRVVNSTFEGDIGDSVIFGSPGWQAQGNRVPVGKWVKHNFSTSLVKATRVPFQRERLVGMVDFSDDPDQGLALGELPGDSEWLDVQVTILVAFNAGSSNYIQIGTTTTKSVLALVEVTGVAAGTVLTPNTAAPNNIGLSVSLGYSAVTLPDLRGFFTPAGTAATTGRALVSIEYARSLTL